MNRFKFKAWHKTEKQMYDVKILTEEGAFLKGAQIGKDASYGDGKLIVRAPKEGRFCENEEFDLLMPFDGKDKNGVPLYEGDICEYYNYYRRKLMVGEIRYFDSCFWFHNNGEIVSFSSLFTGSLPSVPISYPSDFVKIGDIYQNIDLLK